MRLWSIHPKYLDSKGLVALWRESLLAKKVLEGKTQGYKNHPQLMRFKSQKNPETLINLYLKSILEEAISRGYSFDDNKINLTSSTKKINVTFGQINYEFNHLKKKLSKRSLEYLNKLKNSSKIEAHPLFNIIPGNIESWERVN